MHNLLEDDHVLDLVFAGQLKSHSWLVLPKQRDNAHNVNQEVGIVAVLHFVESVFPKPFELNGVLEPHLEVRYLNQVEDGRLPPRPVHDAVIDCKEWNQTHVPELVLRSHDFVKGDKCPSLHRQSKK